MRWWVLLPIASALIWSLYAMGSGRPRLAREATDEERADEPGAIEPPKRAYPEGPPDLPRQRQPTATTPTSNSPPRESPPATSTDAPGKRMSLEAFERRRAFLAETRDDPWAEERESALTGQLAKLPVERGELLGVDCRARLCRVAFAFEDEADLEDNEALFDDLRRMFGMSLAAEHLPMPDGRHRVIFYVHGT